MFFLYRKVPAGRSKFPHSTCDLAPGEVRAAESRPALEKRGVWFLSLQPSSVRCYRGLQHFGGGGGTYLSRLSLSRHLPRLRSRPALSVFLHARLFRLGFGTRGGRGSGMRYFRALGYVPPPHGPGWKRLGRPAPSRPRDFGLRTAGPLGPPLLARRPKPWSP